MKIPIFPLDVVLFPYAPLQLHIFEERYKEMIGECLQRNAEFGVVRSQTEGLAIMGCTARIRSVLRRYPDGRLDILCEGTCRFEIEQLDNDRSFLQAEVDLFDDVAPDSHRDERAACIAEHLEVMSLIGVGRESYSIDLDSPVSFYLAADLPADLGLKQRILGTHSDRTRTAILRDFYRQILPKLRAGAQKRSGPEPVM